MIYREFKGKQLSALGMGCRRLPIVGDDQSKIDMDAVREMVGDKKFIASLKDYWKEFGYRIATPGDLIATFISHCGKSIDKDICSTYI